MTIATETTSPATTSPAARRRHWEMLVVSSLAIVLAFLLVVRADGRVALRGLHRFPVPETCLSHSLFHIDCPACGMTRSFIELARGDLHASLGYHRLGWLMAVAVLAQFPYRTVCLRTGRTPSRRVTSLFGLALIAALILYWLLARL